jgi:ATP-dependent Clp protease ATP-binding subunit ClpA
MKMTERLRSMLHLALRHAQDFRRINLEPKDVFIALLNSNESLVSLALVGDQGIAEDRRKLWINQLELLDDDVSEASIGVIDDGDLKLSACLQNLIDNELKNLEHFYAGPEHLFLAMCGNSSIQVDSALQVFQSDRYKLRSAIMRILGASA